MPIRYFELNNAGGVNSVDLQLTQLPRIGENVTAPGKPPVAFIVSRVIHFHKSDVINVIMRRLAEKEFSEFEFNPADL